jgi:hypothetical protein
MMNRQLDVQETQVVRVFLFFILKISYALRLLVNIIMTKSSSHCCFQEGQLKLSMQIFAKLFASSMDVNHYLQPS